MSDNGKGPSARNSYGGYGFDEGGLQGQGGGPCKYKQLQLDFFIHLNLIYAF